MAALIIDREKKKEHILLSAINIFASKGFTKTTINDIAVSANIGKGTVYEYFKSKDEIIQDAFLFFTSSMTNEFTEIMSLDLNGKDKLVNILKAFCTYFTNKEKPEGIIEVILDFWAEGMRSDNSKTILNENMREMYIAYRKFLIDIIKQGIDDGSFKNDIDPFSISATVIAMLDGLMLQWILDKKTIDVKSIIKSFTDLILNGIEKKSIKEAL